MSEQFLLIDERYRGPPRSANGGYVCGLLAQVLGGPAEVTLRLPPPIGRPLLLRRLPEASVVLLDRDALVAEAVPGTPDVHVPGAVGPRAAAEAARRYPGFAVHPFPTCFVCGPARAAGDGLRVFPGAVTGRDVVAAPWAPEETLGDDGGLVRPEYLWAALDCPGAFANGFPEEPMVLGRMSAEILSRPRVGQPCVAVGWSEGSEARKRLAGTALFADDGRLMARARATWIRIDPQSNSNVGSANVESASVESAVTGRQTARRWRDEDPHPGRHGGHGGRQLPGRRARRR